MYSIVACVNFAVNAYYLLLFTELLLSNGSCTAAYFAAVAKQRVICRINYRRVIRMKYRVIDEVAEDTVHM
jgi:hypothetical protein